MFIEKLSIKNFKNIREADFEFGKVNLITGETGEGKTAIIEALTFLMTNTLQDKIEEYVRWGQKEFTLSEVFLHRGKKYSYDIKAGKATDRKLSIDGGDPSFKSDAVRELETVIDPTLTLYSNIALQHKSTELLFEKPTPRLQKIKDILKISHINAIVEAIKNDSKEIQQNIENKETELTVLRGLQFELILEPKLPEMDITSSRKAKDDFEVIKKKYEHEKNEYTKYLEKKGEYEEALVKKKVHLSLIKSIDDELIRLDGSLRQPPEFDTSLFAQLTDQLSVIRVGLMALKNELRDRNKAEDEIREYNRKIENRESEIAKIKIHRISRSVPTQEDVTDLEKKYLDSSNAVATLTSRYEAIKEGKCPTCGANYTMDGIEDAEKELNSATVILNESRAKYQDKKNELKEYTQKQNENLVMQSRIDGWNKDIHAYRNEIQKIMSQLSDPYDEAKEKELSLQESSLMAEIIVQQARASERESIIKGNKATEDAIQKQKGDKISLQSKIEEIDALKEPIEYKITTEYNENAHITLDKKIEEYEKAKIELDQAKKFNEAIGRQKKENQKKITDVEQTIYTFREEVQLLKETANLLDKDFSSYLIDVGSNYIKEKMNVFFQKSYGKYQIDFKQDGKGIEFYYSEDGKEFHSVNMLSGFEKQLFSVAFRVALCSIQDLNLMCLDEIDSDASDAKSMRLYQTVLNEGFAQLFIVTHNSSTQEFFYNLPYARVFEIKQGEVQ